MAASDREIELKFTCESSDIPAVLAVAPVGEDETRQLVSTYFDTPHQTLRKAGASLRIRASGDRRVQTLKRGTGFARKEHEAQVDQDTPNPSLGPLPDMLPRRARGALAPTFSVSVTRRQRLLPYAGAEIELAVDEGEVRAGEAARRLCEVELELKAGPPEALFALARELGRAAPLYLSFETKAAWGAALLDDTVLAPRKGGQARLVGDETTAGAFQVIARDALNQIAANAALIREAASSEAVHQIRVASRRLLSAMSTFKPLVVDDRQAELKAELKWLTGACSEARALDVFAAETLSAARHAEPGGFGLAELGLAIEAARSRAHARVAAAVASARFRALVLETCAWVELGDWRSSGREARRPVAAFARRALARRRSKLLKAGRNLARLDDAARHRLRIEAKRLRYAAEAFAPLYDEPAARGFIAALKELQDHLGALNDAVGLQALLTGLPLEGSALFAAGRLVGETASDKARQVKQAAAAMEAFAAQAPFWERPAT